MDDSEGKEKKYTGDPALWQIPISKLKPWPYPDGIEIDKDEKKRIRDSIDTATFELGKWEHLIHIYPDVESKEDVFWVVRGQTYFEAFKDIYGPDKELPCRMIPTALHHSSKLIPEKLNLISLFDLDQQIQFEQGQRFNILMKLESLIQPITSYYKKINLRQYKTPEKQAELIKLREERIAGLPEEIKERVKKAIDSGKRTCADIVCDGKAGTKEMLRVAKKIKKSYPDIWEQIVANESTIAKENNKIKEKEKKEQAKIKGSTPPKSEKEVEKIVEEIWKHVASLDSQLEKVGAEEILDLYQSTPLNSTIGFIDDFKDICNLLAEKMSRTVGLIEKKERKRKAARMAA